MALPRGTTGSLWPTFVSARAVTLAVRRACVIALNSRCPTGLSPPSRASVTFWEATAPVKLPAWPCLGSRYRDGRLDALPRKSGISPLPPRRPRPPAPRLPPILDSESQTPTSSCSKGSRGLSVQPRVLGIFTETTISPDPSKRQRPSRYAIRAGRNLPDKEFRYLRTVIVTAAVYRGLDSRLRPEANLSS